MGDGGGSGSKGRQEMATEAVEDVTKEVGTRGLIRATLGSCPRNDDEKIEANTE